MNRIRWFGRSTVFVSGAASSREEIWQKTGRLAAPSAGAKNPLSIPGSFPGVLNSSEIAREGVKLPVEPFKNVTIGGVVETSEM
jgi:hypothetical protein